MNARSARPPRGEPVDVDLTLWHSNAAPRRAAFPSLAPATVIRFPPRLRVVPAASALDHVVSWLIS